MWKRLSISSISDWEDVFRFILSIPDIVTCSSLPLVQIRPRAEAGTEMLGFNPSTPKRTPNEHIHQGTNKMSTEFDTPH
jgi:hypothetical protein